MYVLCIYGAVYVWVWFPKGDIENNTYANVIMQAYQLGTIVVELCSHSDLR